MTVRVFSIGHVDYAQPPIMPLKTRLTIEFLRDFAFARPVLNSPSLNFRRSSFISAALRPRRFAISVASFLDVDPNIESCAVEGTGNRSVKQEATSFLDGIVEYVALVDSSDRQSGGCEVNG